MVAELVRVYCLIFLMLVRYNSLNVTRRHVFGFEEDNLISIILHNLLVYMLMMGLGPHKTTDLIHKFSAQTRLAVGEERLLQQTLKYIEKCMEEDVRLEPPTMLVDGRLSWQHITFVVMVLFDVGC